MLTQIEPSPRHTSRHFRCLAANAKPLSIEEAELWLILRGSTRLAISEETITLESGDILLLQRGDTINRLLEYATKIQYIRIELTGRATKDIDFLARARANKIRLLPGAKAERKVAAHIMEAMAWEESAHEYPDHLLALLRESFVSICQRQIEKNASVRKSVTPARDLRLQRVIDAINRRLGETVDWAAEARKTGFSPHYFRKYFQKTMGISPGQYLLEARIRRAEELIRSSDANISQICYEVGFQSMSAFNAAFRKITSSYPSYFRACIQHGLTPDRYEKNLLSQAELRCRPRWHKPYSLAHKSFPKDWRHLELSAFFNRPVRRAVKGETWFGPSLDFDFLPTERQVYHGIPFHLLPESSQQKNTCLILRSRVMRGSRNKIFPTKVVVPLPPSLRALYVLHACAWGRECQAFASYTLSYQDGAEHRLPIAPHGIARDNSRNSETPPMIQDWWPGYPQFCHGSARPVPVVNPANDAMVRYLYTTEILNPRINAKLDSLIIESAPQREATLAVLAITALEG